eukprot:TRINITY_DN52668_c0_g2_i1.p1 TRINITY_DN52668_c0_g2~~TRINITY_DN52668_c0_g2_i1.p1  ORF type:complete len:280 (+),score=2.28 TRINITY_DN52668_c0_g2_i1:57-896(+)
MSDNEGCCCCAMINTAETGVIERYGKFVRLADPGCVCVCWPIEEVSGIVSLRLQQLNISCETKTKDNVFVTVHVSVQYQVIKTKIYEAHYVLTNHKNQMTAYIYDVLRSAICGLTLDGTFEAKEEISTQLKDHLKNVMDSYGYTILQTLVTDIAPDSRVRDAMNEINSSKRYKEAAYQRAEGEKVVKVKRAEAEAESMYLSGVGVARSRKAIVDGLRDSIVEFSSNVSGTTAKDAMDLLVLTQYFDTLHDIGQVPGTKAVFLANNDNPFRSGIMEANGV